MLCKVTHSTGHVSANTSPHQLRWVTKKWRLLYHAQNAVRWLVLCMQQVEVSYAQTSLHVAMDVTCAVLLTYLKFATV